VKKYFDLIRTALFSATIKDTFVLFSGNVLSAFWSFLFTLFVARAFSVYDFGIFSAAINLISILSSIADIGISTGSVNFVSEHIARGEHEKANEYIKASFLIRLFIVLAISAVVAIFAPFVSKTLLATRDPMIAIWSAVVPIFLFPDAFFPYILQAKKKFFHSTLIDNAFYIARLLFALGFFIVGGLTMSKAFWAFGAGFLVECVLVVIFIKTDFLHSRPQKDEYKNLLKFSGWMGVNRVISSISGKLDVQMLIIMAGAVSTGLYSIPSKLAGFIVVLAGSFSSVLAPRLAGFRNKESEKSYIVKSLLALLPIVAGVIFWIIIAKPFMLLLFGKKYLASVPIFQALAAAEIPFLFTAPSTSAIIYSMKKTVYIGAFSFFQLAAIFLLDLFLIPKYGVYGPVITLGLTNIILVVYSWFFVIKHYWGKEVKTAL
jgi:O-antigen/teichoic acid export membrane protein